MDTASMRRRAALQERARRADWGAVAAWLLCFGLVAFLGAKGGGYDPLVHDQVGIAIWWILLLGVTVGALPRRRPPALAWVAIGLLAAFVAWTWLSMGWTESADRTSADLARVAGYLGIFCLAVFIRGGVRRTVGAVACGIVFVTVLALLSRLHPAWFADADQTARFLEDSERLSYPLNYWNGLAALIAIGLPLVLQVATGARSALLRAAAAAALPALALTLFFTLSRGGIAASVIALAVFLVFTSDRLQKLPTLFLAGVGSAILIAAADQRDSLQHGLQTSTAHSQGDVMLVIVLLVCLAVGAAQGGLSLVLRRRKRPRWAQVSRRHSLAVAAVALLVVLIAAAAIGAPGRAADGWSEFKDGGGPGKGTGRLGSVAGQNRYQFWSAAARENATKPLTGTGSGTFEYWWARDGDSTETVRDTHSLYMQTLGELGIVGLALLAGFLLLILLGGARNLLLADVRRRSALAAAIAGCAGFCLTATVDWMWQIPVLAVCLFLLGSALVSEERSAEQRAAAFPPSLRLVFVLTALVAIVVIAIPLASTSLVRQSEADARADDLPAALQAARSAQNVQPDAATPRLQQALVLEVEGDLAAAAEAARAATERESTNWRTWLVLSRIEAERGMAGAAIRDYRRARSLNPNASLFNR